MIYESIQEFPAGVGQTDVTLRAVNVVGVQESPYSLARETQVFPGARWELEISILPTERKEAQKLEAFLLSLRGRAGRFRCADPYFSLPLGSVLGSPTVLSAAAGAEVLQSQGWMANRQGLLLAGDFIELDLHLHRVLQDVNADASGNASISVWPPLREASDPLTPIIVKNPRGVFALADNSLEMTRNVDLQCGVSLKAVEVVAPRPIPVVARVAMMGDSMTDQAAAGLYDIRAYGAVSQARARCGSKFDFVANNAGELHFSTYGLRSDQIMTTWLPQVLVSNAQACAFMCGANDAVQGISTAVYVGNVVSMARSLQAGGIVPIFLAPPPLPLTYAGPPSNSAGAISARLADYWRALPMALAAVGCIYIPCPTDLEATPGARDGIGNDAYFMDHLHPNYLGMSCYGRALAPVMINRLSLAVDPYDIGGTIITTNPHLAGSGGQPTDWFAPTVPSGATLNSKTLVDLGDGTFAWELDYSQGTATGSLLLGWSGAQVGGSPAGKTVDGIATVQVMSGSFAFTSFKNFSYFTGLQTGYDMRVPTGEIEAATLFPSDGPIVLRAPKSPIDPSQVLVGPLIEVAGSGVLRITKAWSRSFP